MGEGEAPSALFPSTESLPLLWVSLHMRDHKEEHKPPNPLITDDIPLTPGF